MTKTPIQPNQMRNSRIKLYIYILIGSIVIGTVATLAILLNWYQDAINIAPSDKTDTLTIVIDPGETLLSEAGELQAGGVLKSADALRIYFRLNNPEINLQAGTYQIPQNLNVPQLIAFLKQGPKIISVKATIPEGLRYDEIVDIITAAFADADHTFDSVTALNIIENPDNYAFSSPIQVFLDTYKPQGKNLEGFLFPDTYNLGVDAGPQDVIEVMIGNLITRLSENELDPSSTGRLDSFYEVLTLASILERESNGEEEAAVIADIFLKRLEEGIVLGADAPILYPYKRWTPGLTQAEIDTLTPYNTRRRAGLTPTPIANPGISTIKAVLNPEPNPYYFFIHDRDGIARYGRTQAEHENNIARYGLAF